MKTPASCFAIVLALAAMIVAPVASARADDREEAPIEIEKCQTISQPGSYKLVNNLVSTSGNCLVIAADFVTVDLAGFSITGSGTGAGWQPSGGRPARGHCSKRVDTGVLLEAADGSIVEGLRISGPAAGGVGIDAHGIVKGDTLILDPRDRGFCQRDGDRQLRH